MAANVPGIETADHEVVEVEHDVDALTELFNGASVVCNTVGPFSQFGPEVVEACLAAGVPLPRHHRRAGLADHLRRAVRRRLRGRGPAARRRASRRCTRPARSPPSSASRQPGLDTLDIAVFWGGSPTIASTQTILVNAATVEGVLPRAEQVRASGTPRPGSTSWPSPASTSSRWPCPGAARRTRCGSSATRAWPTSRCSAACSTSR